MLSTYTIWDQLWSALVTTLAKIVWTLLKAENRHTSQKKWNSAGCQSPGVLLLLPSTFFRLFLRFLPCFPMAAVFTYFRLYLVAPICHRVSLCHAAPCCHDSGQPGTESCCCRPAQSARPARGHYTQPRQRSNISCDIPTYTVFIN